MKPQPSPFGPQDTGPDMKRLIPTIIVMMGLWMGFNYFFPPSAPEQTPEEPVKTATADTPKTPAKVEAAPTPAAPAGAFEATNTPEQFADVHLDPGTLEGTKVPEAIKGEFKAKLSSLGGQVSHYNPVGYPTSVDADAKPRELANAVRNGTRLFALASRGGDVKLMADAPYTVGGTKAVPAFHRETAEGLAIDRTYDFSQPDLTVKLTTTLKNNSDKPLHLELDLLMAGEAFPDDTQSNIIGPSMSNFAAACHVEGERKTADKGDLEDGPVSEKGAVTYAAVDHHYFLIAAIPGAGTATTGCTTTAFTQTTKEDDPGALLVALHQAPIDLQPGQTVVLNHTGFIGPKQLDLLKVAGHKLDENVDFGWFGVISKPLLVALVWLYGVTGNYGIAIILLTMLMKLLTFPLTQKSYISMQKTKQVAPKLKELQKKYGHDKALLGQKQMEFYKEAGVNPAAGCLPMLIQMPVWFALYRTLWKSVELFQQPFAVWLTDLSAPDPFYVLPVIMGLTMFIQSRFQPTPADQPQMKYVQMGMPFFLTFIMLNMPAGLTLYMVTNNFLSIAQQAFIKRKYPDTPVEGANAKA